MNAHNEQHDPASPVVKQNLTTQPAAAQEAVGEMVCRASGITVPQMYGSQLPAGTKLYAAPVAAAPVLYGVPDGKGGVKLGKGWAFSKEPDRALGTTQPLFTEAPAAPGIDLRPIRYALKYAAAAARENTHSELAEDFDELIRKLDASPKGELESWKRGTKACAEVLGQVTRQMQDSPKDGSDTARLDSGMIRLSHRDEFGEDGYILHTGVNLRAAIDAAMKAQAGDAEVQP